MVGGEECWGGVRCDGDAMKEGGGGVFGDRGESRYITVCGNMCDVVPDAHNFCSCIKLELDKPFRH